jgi:small subunit ribosomal protein S6
VCYSGLILAPDLYLGPYVHKEVQIMEEVKRAYETVFILSTKLDEDATNAMIQKFKDLIAANGTIDGVDEWGKRRLAYPINKENEGYYVLVNFTSVPSFTAELDRIYKITDGVLRSLIVKKGA